MMGSPGCPGLDVVVTGEAIADCFTFIGKKV